MDSLVLKKAIFYPTEIILIKKKGNIIISIDDIESVFYYKPNAGYYLAGFFGAATMATMFRIHLHTEINGKKLYCLIVSYKDVIKLQKFFQKEIIIY